MGQKALFIQKIDSFLRRRPIFQTGPDRVPDIITISALGGLFLAWRLRRITIGMRFSYITMVIVLLLVGSGRCFPQGFLNLNSDPANLSDYSRSEPVPTQNALPDWPAYFGPANNATFSGSAPMPGNDGNSIGGLGPIQGQHNAPLESSSSTATTTAAPGPAGTIPVTARSLVISTNISGGSDVSFDGHALTLVDVSNAMNCAVYNANFPDDAGQTDPLFCMPSVETATELDNQYSTSIAPELNAFDCQP